MKQLSIILYKPLDVVLDIFENIKDIGGIRLEAKGRLSRSTYCL